MKCRACRKKKLSEFIDLGFSPPSNSYLKKKSEIKNEKNYPLKTFYCTSCFFVQTQDFLNSKTFFNKNYAYFSGYSQTYVKHCINYKKKIIKNYNLDPLKDIIYEIASNDGTLLKNFYFDKFKCIGIEPSTNTSKISEKIGIINVKDFFGLKLSRKVKKKYGKAKLIIANNVLAHVPDINNFLKGHYNLLRDDGLITFEFPHLLNLIKYNQFDTIYHEHYSYLSIIALKKLLSKNNLKIFKIEKLNKIHGGSLRVYVSKKNNFFKIGKSVQSLINEEIDFGLKKHKTYKNFNNNIKKVSDDFLKFLIDCRLKKNKIYGYGAAAKANTFLNYLKIDEKLVDGVFDLNKEKINTFLPGSHLKVFDAKKIKKYKPNIIIIFVWNLKDEILNQLKKNLNLKTKFVTAIPKIKIYG